MQNKGQRARRRAAGAAAARAASLAHSQGHEDCGGPSTIPQQPLPDDAFLKSNAQDGDKGKAPEATKQKTPEPMILDRDVEYITQQTTESDLDAIEAEKDGPITMLCLSNDIAILTEHSRKLTRENSVLRRKVEKEVKASAEKSKQFKQELNVCFLGLELLAKRLGQDPDEVSPSKHDIDDHRVG